MRPCRPPGRCRHSDSTWISGCSGPPNGAAGCASLVAGLDPDGEGFLVVRSGPGTGYRKLDELHNGDSVRICHRSGNRIGVTCRSQGAERKGWVHGRWLRDGAG